MIWPANHQASNRHDGPYRVCGRDHTVVFDDAGTSLCLSRCGSGVFNQLSPRECGVCGVAIESTV